jgi:hypothetical protein
LQDRYAGDVGDYGKYGLLRALVSGAPALRLGVVWYLTDERIVARDTANDGRHIAYLEPPQERRFRDCDPELYDTIRKLFAPHRERSVAEVERLGVLPPGTVTFTERLITPLRTSSREERLQDRLRWIGNALRRTEHCDVVFVDPDNGLETPSVPIHSARAPKYAFLSELQPFVLRGQTLVIYHHLGRRPNVPDILRRAHECSTRLGRPVMALRYRRGTARAFLVVPAPEHEALAIERIDGMLSGHWGRHFELVTAPDSGDDA